MTPTTRRVLLVFMSVLSAGLILACAPWLSDTHPEITKQPFAWQCPTATPIPTITLWVTPTPTGSPISIFSTPEPTATPYIRQGSDFYQGQRVAIGPLRVMVTGRRQVPNPHTPDRAYHLIEVQIENTTSEAVEAHLEIISLIRTVERIDGRKEQNAWYPSEAAAKELGLDMGRGSWPPGTASRVFVYDAPGGTPLDWGMPFINSGQLRNGPAGDGQLWIQLIADPYCGGHVGGPPSDAIAPLPPVGTPAVGRGRWPVPLGTPISRAYGCHQFWTGMRDPNACPTAKPYWHDGIDFAAAIDTPVFATTAITIDYAGADTSSAICPNFATGEFRRGFGQYIKAHDTHGYTYWYGHLSSMRVKAGDHVATGTPIGAIGTTGCAAGPHLHFRVRLGNQDINPLDVIQERTT